MSKYQGAPALTLPPLPTRSPLDPHPVVKASNFNSAEDITLLPQKMQLQFYISSHHGPPIKHLGYALVMASGGLLEEAEVCHPPSATPA